MQVYTAIQYFLRKDTSQTRRRGVVFLVDLVRANIAAKNVRNPKTDESIKIPAHNTTKVHGRNKT
jgi:nucleoid DNA-binding protein